MPHSGHTGSAPENNSRIGVNISFNVPKFPRMLRKLFGPKRDEVTGQ
jgi:hypothetical protein